MKHSSSSSSDRQLVHAMRSRFTARQWRERTVLCYRRASAL